MGIGDMDLGFGRTRRQICYHEAGHAVFYYHANLKINFVHVPGEGNVCAEWPNHPHPEQAIDLAASCVAAWYTEARGRGETFPHMSFEDFMAYAEAERADMQFAPLGLVSDSAEALDMLELAASRYANPQDKMSECYKAMCDTVDRNLEFWWPEIEALAKRVFVADDGYLEGNEVAGIIEAARGEGS